MKHRLPLLYGFIIFFITIQAHAQTVVGLGACGIYNIQTEGIGLGVRAQFRLFRNLSVVPQVYYFPSFNKIHELFIGANLHYEIYKWKRFTPYLAGGGFYNDWINSDEFKNNKAKPSNFMPEIGVGVLFGKKCWKPFIEQRYNPLWQEGAFRLGIMWYPNCNTKGPGPNRRTYACPAIQ